MASIGWATLTVIPEVSKVPSGVAKQIGAPLTAAGKKAGSDMGKAVADGLAGAKAAVQKSSGVLAAARNKEADAAGKLKIAESQLQELVDKGISSGARHTAAVEKVAKAQRDSAAAADKSKKAAGDLASAETNAADAAKNLASESGKAADNVEDIGKKSMLSADNLVKFGAVAAVGVAAVATALFKVGSDFTNVSNTIRIGTGATGDALEGLNDSAMTVGKNVPASFADIGSTVADVNTRLGLTGSTLETFSSQILESGRMFGSEIDINGLTQAFSAFGVQGEETTAVMDQFFQISQATGVGMNELAAASVKGAPALKEFGFTIGDSAALVGQLDKAGIDSASTLGAMQKGLVKIAQEGKDPRETLFSLVGEIEKLTAAGEGAQAIDLASGMFGTRGAAQFVDAVKSGTLGVDNFMAATNATSDTILGVAEETRTFSDQLTLFKNQGLAAIEPVATRVFGVMTDGLKWIKDVGAPAVARFGEVLSDAFSGDGISAFLDGVFPTLQSIAGVAQDLGVTVLPVLWSGIQFGIGIVTGLVSGLAAAVGWFEEHRIVAGTLAAIITVGLLPALVSLAVGFATSAAAAVASGATTAAVWVMLQVNAIASAAAQVAASYRTVAGWVASGAAAVANGAIMVAQWVAAGATATLQAGIAAGAWVAASARTVGSLALQGAAFVAQKAIMVASAAATGIATAAQWALNVAMSANPIGLIIAAVVALVAGLVWFFTQTEIGQKIVTAAWDAILSGWNWMYDAVSSGIQLLGDGLGYIGEKAGEAKDWVVGKFNDLVDFVTGLPGRISSAASGMWDGLTASFKAAINWIISKWNDFRLVIGGGTILGKQMPSITLDTPNIPMLAAGGVAGRGKDGKLFGPGTGTSDSILGVNEWGMPTALVSDEEGVVKKTAMDSGGDRIVAALNAGWVPTADFLHGMLQGDFRANSLGIEEDNPLVGGALDLHRMLSSLPRFADGGELGGGTINASIWDAISAKFPDAQLSSGYRPGDPGFHGVKQAIDVSGPDMQGYADYAFNELRGDLAQIIWNNGPVWYNVKDNQLGTGVATAEGAEARGIYGEGTMAGHADHVHLAAEKPLGPVVAPTSPDLASAAPADMGAWTDSAAPSAASPAGATADAEKSFSARDRYKKMFTDIGGIWADASLEIFGAGEWLDLADRYTIKSSDSPASTVGTSVPVTPMSPDSAAAADPVTALTDVPDINRTGADLYSYEIARAAKEMGLGEAAAVIGEATALVESGDPLKMWANQKLPESLNLPHDAVGNDGTSTGLFQQQDNGAWGSLEQRMNPFESAKLFYDALPSGWEGMDPGAVAQQVQRSAFGEKYGPMMGRGQELVDQANLFDTGGVWQPNTWGFNGLSKPELVLKDAHWKVAEANISKVDELVGAGGGAGNSGATINQTFHTTVADQAGFHRRANRDRSLAMMQYGGRPEIGR